MLLGLTELNTELRRKFNSKTAYLGTLKLSIKWEKKLQIEEH
jgi:hypothetical protein